MGDNPTKEQASEAMKHINERMAANPSGVLVYHPTGTQPFSFGKFLGIEFGTECLEALLAVFLLAQTRVAGFGGRVGFIFVAGILASIATNVSYWSGAATATSGVGTLLGSQLTSGLAVVVNAAQTAFTGGSLIGNNSASWNPTLITIPSAAVVGTFTGTVTHTVA